MKFLYLVLREREESPWTSMKGISAPRWDRLNYEFGWEGKGRGEATKGETWVGGALGGPEFFPVTKRSIIVIKKGL